MKEWLSSKLKEVKEIVIYAPLALLIIIGLPLFARFVYFAILFLIGMVLRGVVFIIYLIYNGITYIFQIFAQ